MPTIFLPRAIDSNRPIDVLLLDESPDFPSNLLKLSADYMAKCPFRLDMMAAIAGPALTTLTADAALPAKSISGIYDPMAWRDLTRMLSLPPNASREETAAKLLYAVQHAALLGNRLMLSGLVGAALLTRFASQQSAYVSPADQFVTLRDLAVAIGHPNPDPTPVDAMRFIESKAGSHGVATWQNIGGLFGCETTADRATIENKIRAAAALTLEPFSAERPRSTGQMITRAFVLGCGAVAVENYETFLRSLVVTTFGGVNLTGIQRAIFANQREVLALTQLRLAAREIAAPVTLEAGAPVAGASAPALTGLARAIAAHKAGR